MCDAFNGILAGYTRTVPPNQASANYPPVVDGVPYLRTHLQFMLTGSAQRSATIVQTRTGLQHTLVKKKQQGDYRLALPSTIRNALEEQQKNNAVLWAQANVTATWVVCYLSGIHPDHEAVGWQNFECSHTCCFNRQQLNLDGGVGGWICVTPECLTWESKAANQGRGQDFCTRACSHNCGQCVCVCQDIHNPPCR